MKKLIPFLLLLAVAAFLGTTTSPGSRGLNIDGLIGGQSQAVAGTGSFSWEDDEALSGNGTTWYLSWDVNNLFVGREGGDNAQPQIIYLQAEYPGATYTTTPVTYDNFNPDFTNLPINYIAYFNSTPTGVYNVYESGWGGNTTLITPPVYQTHITSGANMEIIIPWYDITHGNGTPTHFRAVFYQTNGNNTSILAYGESPDINPDGAVSAPVISSWWGGYSVTGGVAPNGFSDDPLPVELVSLAATSQHNSVSLQWVTATEKNNYGFEVERRNASSAENEFKRISFVQGAGTSNNTRDYLFVDERLQSGKYVYRLKQIDNDGSFIYSHEVEVSAGAAPEKFELAQNYPNPFNPSTTISFTLPVSGMTTLKVYDVAGKDVATLVNENLEAGVHQRAFNASNLASGIYFARLQSGGKQMMKKLLLLK